MDKKVFLTNEDLHWFTEGTHCRLYEKFGAHLCKQDGTPGVSFSVWAPEAAQVFVMGDFNGWSKKTNPLQKGDAGIWSGFIAGVRKGATYKYHIVSRHNDYAVDKADPYGTRQRTAPLTASLVWDLDYDWGDGEWMNSRGQRQKLDSPISIYEVHLGSWVRVPEEGNRWLTYRELAPKLAEYVERHGFTHVEFLPVMKHPFYGSWGYQTTCYFAPTGRYGSPQDLMFLIDTLHQRGIGVILDWVPSHFAADEYGLAFFDGSHLYEAVAAASDQGAGSEKDPGVSPTAENAEATRSSVPKSIERRPVLSQWNSHSFNYGRPEVCSFLLSNAIFWLERYHVDGLRLDAVASMLYLDHARKPGEWVPNQHGGRENLEAVEFLRRFNETVYREFPDTQTYAEESTAWPLVSRPTYVGGLGFGFKWDMGWMHDTLKYFSQDPIHRKHRHVQLTFRGMYAFAENFVLSLSHDEVARGKGSLLSRMPGDDWRRFANLRLLFAYQWAQPGKKLLFMGSEFGQWNEWDHESSLDWHLTEEGSRHNRLQRLVGHLNWLYRHEPALHEGDAMPDGFEWVDPDDSDQSTLSFLRKSERTGDLILAAFNFTPVPRHNARVGVPRGGFWREILNTDAQDYGGSGQGNHGQVEAAPFGWHYKSHSLHITLPPLGAVFLKHERQG